MSQQAPSDFQGQSTAQAAPQVPRAGAPLAEEQISSSPDESLRELAARANAAVDKGMKQLSQQEAGPGGSAPRPDGGNSGSRRGERQPQAAASAATAAERPRRERQRSPDETALRDVNRDRLLGLLTERAAKTLLFYFSELNPTLMQWLEYYIKSNPIPSKGSWEDVSGETFLRKLLAMPVEQTRWNFGGRDEMYSKSSPLGVDPRQIAQRIMDIRSQIAREWIQELQLVDEENALLMRETVLSSFSLDSIPVVDPAQVKGSSHPELQHPDFTDDSAAGTDD
ncbi:hypothetical protein C2E20_7133 [Micractinium conductrix]|uniref:Uncharacterized protein n=1 Tax=Micractinium conductrix TaxID=554055 RepID=A0A2P6V5Q0_9CHLO|nr:hypothetical protein C2E20_7133 [Micractinium conductrix]|eukprot:PSC69414.1 hypothetical protein C2E20_7133 [Micractinium conductrix]